MALAAAADGDNSKGEAEDEEDDRRAGNKSPNAFSTDTGPPTRFARSRPIAMYSCATAPESAEDVAEVEVEVEEEEEE